MTPGYRNVCRKFDADSAEVHNFSVAHQFPRLVGKKNGFTERTTSWNELIGQAHNTDMESFTVMQLMNCHGGYKIYDFFGFVF